MSRGISLSYTVLIFLMEDNSLHYFCLVQYLSVFQINFLGLTLHYFFEERILKIDNKIKSNKLFYLAFHLLSLTISFIIFVGIIFQKSISFQKLNFFLQHLITKILNLILSSRSCFKKTKIFFAGLNKFSKINFC